LVYFISGHPFLPTSNPLLVSAIYGTPSYVLRFLFLESDTRYSRKAIGAEGRKTISQHGQADSIVHVMFTDGEKINRST